MHEASCHKDNSFVTLTYSPERLWFRTPDGEEYQGARRHMGDVATLHPADFQRFMRDLRQLRRRAFVGTPGELFVGPRFLQAGEYGELGRPHHHALIFGAAFGGLTPWQKRGVHQLYRSLELEKLWPHGFSSVGTLTFESANYVARYTLKKLTGARANDDVRAPEYATMSLKPGIGTAWLLRFGAEVYPSDEVALRGGVLSKPPRFYDNFLRKHNPKGYALLKAYREANRVPVSELELYAREIITRARQALGKRKGP